MTLSLLKEPTHTVKLIAGHNFGKRTFELGEANVLMSEKVAKRQYGSAQNALGTTVIINNVTYKVTGVYKTQAQFTDDGNQKLIRS